jgi:hypothetical protein
MPYELCPLIIIFDEETNRPIAFHNIIPSKIIIGIATLNYTSFMLFHELAHCWLGLKVKQEMYELTADLIAMSFLTKIIPSHTEEYSNIIEGSYIASDLGKKFLGEELQKKILDDPEGYFQEIIDTCDKNQKTYRMYGHAEKNKLP